MSAAVAAVGGGHGLAATLLACRSWASPLTAIVSVADDGGSSGRLRAATGLPAPGDLRRCLTALAAPGRATLADALERRFAGGELDGHAAGNLLLAALAAGAGGDLTAAAAEVAAMLGLSPGTVVLPAASGPVDLVAALADGTRVRGQVAVEAAGRIATVELEPTGTAAPRAAVDAVVGADLVVLGPGSLYGSVLAAAVVPDLAEALAKAPAPLVFVANLRPRPPETAGYDLAAHVAALRRHGIEPDVVVTDPAGLPTGDLHDVEVVVAEIARPTGLAHDPERLAPVLRSLLSGSPPSQVGSPS